MTVDILLNTNIRSRCGEGNLETNMNFAYESVHSFCKSIHVEADIGTNDHLKSGCQCKSAYEKLSQIDLTIVSSIKVSSFLA
jgi:hypothetical protein